MKKLLFFLCCCMCVCALVYMCYKSWLGISSGHYTFDLLIQILATAGWSIITFKVVTRAYSWADNLCK